MGRCPPLKSAGMKAAQSSGPGEQARGSIAGRTDAGTYFFLAARIMPLPLLRVCMVAVAHETLQFPLTNHVGAMVTNRITRFVVLNSYANGTALTESHFSLESKTLPALAEGEVLLQIGRASCRERVCLLV